MRPIDLILPLVLLCPALLWHLACAARIAAYARSLGYAYLPWFLGSFFAPPYTLGLALVTLPDRSLGAWRRHELALLERELVDDPPAFGPRAAAPYETIGDLSTFGGGPQNAQAQRTEGAGPPAAAMPLGGHAAWQPGHHED